MTTAYDVAAYIMARKGWVDAFKLQKLVYFTQAWSLAWDGRPLFANRIEAWPNGPVVRDLWATRRHHSHPMSSEVPGGNAQALTPEQVATVEAVIAFYGDLTSTDLINMTHADNPWQEARGDLPAGARSEAEVTVDSMKRCYARRAVLGGPEIPRRAASEAPPADDWLVVSTAMQQAERWRDTLGWLAVR